MANSISLLLYWLCLHTQDTQLQHLNLSSSPICKRDKNTIVLNQHIIWSVGTASITKEHDILLDINCLHVFIVVGVMLSLPLVLSH